jgi:HD-GYP domain-containing protein (c-di-GMP phosphodiesterase class II)
MAPDTRFNGEIPLLKSNPHCPPQAPSPAPAAALVQDPVAWDILTRLLSHLDVSTNASEQINKALEAVREATGADLVCWHDEVSGETLSMPSEEVLSADGYRAVVQKLLAQGAEHNGSIIWRRRYGPGPRTCGQPHSAVAVRLQRSQPGWILALSSRRERPLTGIDVRLIGLAGAMLVKQHHHARLYAEIKGAILGLVRCLTNLIDAKDSCTAGHSERVSRIAVRIGRQLGLAGQAVDDLRLAGLLHDVGKVGVRDEVLLKAGRLTAEEEAHMRTHVVIGDEIVSSIKPFARLRPGVRHHHERYDGQGYPDGLAGEAIPLLARILAVADSCDAMMSARRYRGSMTPPHIDATLLEGAGSQWDPQVVRAFMACRQDIYPSIHEKGLGESVALAIDGILVALRNGSSPSSRQGEQGPLTVAG